MRDIFEDMEFGSMSHLVPVELWQAFGTELGAAMAKDDQREIANIALNFGIEIGVALCRQAHQADGQYELRTKDEWEIHYKRPNGKRPVWKTIRTKVRWKEFSTSNRYAFIHRDDLNMEI